MDHVPCKFDDQEQYGLLVVKLHNSSCILETRRKTISESHEGSRVSTSHPDTSVSIVEFYQNEYFHFFSRTGRLHDSFK